MLRLIRRYRLRVPHGFAILGALLLLTSTITGTGSNMQTPQGAPLATTSNTVHDGESDAPRATSDSVQSVTQAPATKKKRFKVNLFLFRH